MRPRRITATSAAEGDIDLSSQFLEELPLNRPFYSACVVSVNERGSRFTTLGSPIDGNFHIGSVGKGLSGLIYTELTQLGRISPDDRLQDYLPLEGTPAGQVTLESCLTHTSGLPAVGGGRATSIRAVLSVFTGGDPQPESFGALMRQLRNSPVQDPGSFSYSNLAASALGHALAVADGVDYPNLVRARLEVPLGCRNLKVQQPGMQRKANEPKAYTVLGNTQHPWAGAGYAPAGSIRGSALDFTKLLSTMLSVDGPYADAFRVRHTDASGSVAAGWLLDDINGRQIFWHNGYASGFASHVVIDLHRRRGVLISIVTPWPDTDIEAVALELLENSA